MCRVDRHAERILQEFSKYFNGFLSQFLAIFGLLKGSFRALVATVGLVYVLRFFLAD